MNIFVTIASFRHFVISLVFCHKRNPLESAGCESCEYVKQWLCLCYVEGWFS